jgi:hypothetical protein
VEPSRAVTAYKTDAAIASWMEKRRQKEQGRMLLRVRRARRDLDWILTRRKAQIAVCRREVKNDKAERALEAKAKREELDKLAVAPPEKTRSEGAREERGRPRDANETSVADDAGKRDDRLEKKKRSRVPPRLGRRSALDPSTDRRGHDHAPPGKPGARLAARQRARSGRDAFREDRLAVDDDARRRRRHLRRRAKKRSRETHLSLILATSRSRRDEERVGRAGTVREHARGDAPRGARDQQKRGAPQGRARAKQPHARFARQRRFRNVFAVPAVFVVFSRFVWNARRARRASAARAQVKHQGVNARFLKTHRMHTSYV